jgi:hypothetical protein
VLQPAPVEAAIHRQHLALVVALRQCGLPNCCAGLFRQQYLLPIHDIDGTQSVLKVFFQLFRWNPHPLLPARPLELVVKVA